MKPSIWTEDNGKGLRVGVAGGRGFWFAGNLTENQAQRLLHLLLDSDIDWVQLAHRISYEDNFSWKRKIAESVKLVSLEFGVPVALLLGGQERADLLESVLR